MYNIQTSSSEWALMADFGDHVRRGVEQIYYLALLNNMMGYQYRKAYSGSYRSFSWSPPCRSPTKFKQLARWAPGQFGTLLTGWLGESSTSTPGTPTKSCSSSNEVMDKERRGNTVPALRTDDSSVRRAGGALSLTTPWSSF